MYKRQGFHRLRKTVCGLSGLSCRLLLRLFFRLFGCGLVLLDFFFDLGNVLFGGLNPFAALLVKLVDSFTGRVFNPGRNAVGRILAGRAFLCIQAMLALVFGADTVSYTNLDVYKRQGFSSSVKLHECLN